MVLLLSLSLRGQDIHFSQPDANPSFFNPANTGFFTGDFRVGAIYRNQWATVSNPFQTYGLSAEYVAFKRRYYKDGVGIGVNFFGDVAGTSRYGTYQADATVTYFKSLSRFNNHFISLGARIGYGQMGFQTDKLIFSQGSSPQESFETTSERYPDFSAGLAWYFQASDKYTYRAGLAAFHLTQPELTYMNVGDAKLWMRYLGYLKVDIRNWDDYALIPSVIYQRQHNFQEILYGFDLKWFINETYEQFFTFSGGLYFRQMDAFVLALKSEYKTWLFSLSYDANVSGLWKSSHTVGAIELSVLYTYQKTRSIRRKEIPCPVF